MSNDSMLIQGYCGPENSQEAPSRITNVESPDCNGASDDTCNDTISIPHPASRTETEPKNNVTPNETVVNRNRIDLEEIRLSQDYQDMVGTVPVLTNVRVSKPSNYTFFRIRPGSDWCVQIYLLDLGKDHGCYVVHPNIAPFVGNLAVPNWLYTAITRDNAVFLFPVKIPRSEAAANPWTISRMRAVEEAKLFWVRMSSNSPRGEYDVVRAQGRLPDPEWPPNITLQDLLNLAFKDRFIRDLNHPEIQKLEGKI